MNQKEKKEKSEKSHLHMYQKHISLSSRIIMTVLQKHHLNKNKTYHLTKMTEKRLTSFSKRFLTRGTLKYTIDHYC